MSTLSDRIKLAMEEKPCKAADVAKAAGVKEPSVSDWVNGETKSLKAEPALKASQYLGVSPFWLVLGKGPKHSSDIERYVSQLAVEQQSPPYESTVVEQIRPKSKRQKFLDKISVSLDSINEEGLLVAIGRIGTLVEEYPREAKQTPSS